MVPIRWREGVIGAIFLRTERDGAAFVDADMKFSELIADLTALSNAHRFEILIGGVLQMIDEQAKG